MFLYFNSPFLCVMRAIDLHIIKRKLNYLLTYFYGFLFCCATTERWVKVFVKSYPVRRKTVRRWSRCSHVFATTIVPFYNYDSDGDATRRDATSRTSRINCGVDSTAILRRCVLFRKPPTIGPQIIRAGRALICRSYSDLLWAGSN